MTRALIVVIPLIALVLAVAAYYRLGWDRMEHACSSIATGRAQAAPEYSFSSSGFTCTYEDGLTTSSWWY